MFGYIQGICSVSIGSKEALWGDINLRYKNLRLPNFTFWSRWCYMLWLSAHLWLHEDNKLRHTDLQHSIPIKSFFEVFPLHIKLEYRPLTVRGGIITATVFFQECIKAIFWWVLLTAHKHHWGGWQKVRAREGTREREERESERERWYKSKQE